MSRIKEALKVALLAWWLLVSLGIGWELVHLRPTLETTLRDSHTTVLEIGLTASNLRKASLSWEEASKAQALESTAVLTATKDSLVSIRSDVRSVAASANSLLLLTSKAIDHQDRSLLETQSDLQADLRELEKAIQQSNKVLADADAQITDPSIKESLQNVAEGTKQLAEGTAQMAAIATDGRQVADKFRQDYLKPQKFAWELLKQLIGLGGSLAQMIK